MSLDVLRELTNKLPAFPNSINGDYIEQEYRMESGTCFGWFLFRDNDNIGIHRWFNSKDTIFPEHAHDEKEWIIVYKGSMELLAQGEKHVLKKGDYFFLPSRTPHSALMPEDCYYITVTMPMSTEFPDGRKRVE